LNVNTPADADKLRHANRTLRMISECNQMLARAVDETELLHNLCRIAIENGGYHLSWVGIAETDEAKTVRPVAMPASKTTTSKPCVPRGTTPDMAAARPAQRSGPENPPSPATSPPTLQWLHGARPR